MIDDAITRLESLARSQPRHPLPLRYWQQQAHFTTPASDEEMARKAVEHGTEPMRRAMDRLAITAEMLAERLDLPVAAVQAMLDRPRRAPLVMLDGEDAQSLRADIAARGLEAAVRVFRVAEWGNCLRFYRPLGLNMPDAARSLVSVLYNGGRRDHTCTIPNRRHHLSEAGASRRGRVADAHAR